MFQAETEMNVRTGTYRSKRARYTLQACKECQRRKVKCDGKTPCARCVGQKFDCIYSVLAQSHSVQDKCENAMRRRHNAVSEEQAASPNSITLTAKVPKCHTFSTTSLPEHVETTRRQDLALHRSPPEYFTNAPEFCGPSSTEYTFNAVNGNLRAIGMQSAIPDKHSGSGIPSTSSGRLAQYGPFIKLLTMDPLWDMSREDTRSLIDDWCGGLGTVYPIVSRRTMMDTAKKIFNSLDLAHSEGLREQGGSVAEAIFDYNTNKLKILLAIGMTKEAGGREHQAQRLFQSTSEAVEGLIWDPKGIHGIQLLFLAAMYHYHLDEEVRTGRCIAFAARLCLEAGLHRRAMLEKIFPEAADYAEALQTFWAVYMLERRLSLGQGIPFSIQDSYIDRSLYTIKTANPLLEKLLQWTKLAGKTWHALNNQTEKTYECRLDDINNLDDQILEWYESLPEQLQLADSTIWTQDAHHQPTYYQLVLFVRKAHLRNLIYRPVLQFAVQSRQNESILFKAIEISKQTIRILFRLNQHTTSIRTHPMFFQQLLLTAFGNLLLAVVSTGPRIRNSVREEFDMFLHLFQLLSSECAALRRTWQRLQGLRDLHTKLSHSDRGTEISCLDNSEIVAGSNAAATLSFNDIFPLIPSQSTRLDTADISNNLTADAGLFPGFEYITEDFLNIENVFEFPFLSRTS